MIKFDLNRDNLTFIGLAVVVLLLLGQCNRNASLRRDVKELEGQVSESASNFKAAQDTVKVYSNKNGYMIAEISSFKLSNQDLLKANKQLAKDYTNALSLNKRLKNVNTLLRAELTSKDSIPFNQALNSDSTFRFEDYNDYGDNSYRRITVDGKIQDSTITGKIELEQNIRLWLAIENKSGLNTLKLSTKYPFDNFDLQGIELINKELNKYQKKSRWNVSAGVGIGVIPNSVTGLSLSPTVGVMLGWSPKWLQF